MSVLKPQGAAPEFTKGQNKSETHKYVAQAWYEQTLSFDQVMQSIETELKEREDIEDSLESMEPAVNDKGQFCFRYIEDGREFIPTEHALNQYGVYLGISTYHLTDLRTNTSLSAKCPVVRDREDAEILKLTCENMLRRVDPATPRKFRTYTDGTMRAFLSEKYEYIDNRWYLEAVNEIIPDGRFSHWRGNADRFNGNVLIPDAIMDKPDGDSDYGGMINCRNSELGNGKNIETPSLFRAICMNGCIWGQTKGKGVGRVHRGKFNLTDIAKSIYENITTQIPLFTVTLERFLETRKCLIGDTPMSDVIAQCAIDYKMTSEEAVQTAKEFSTYERNDRNLFGLINSITRAGQHFSPDRVIELDAVGGSLIGINWDTFLKRAATIDKEKKEKVFGVSA